MSILNFFSSGSKRVASWNNLGGRDVSGWKKRARACAGVSRVRIAHLLQNARMIRKDRDLPADYASRARGDRANAGPRSVVSRHCRAKKPRLPRGEFWVAHLHIARGAHGLLGGGRPVGGEKRMHKGQCHVLGSLEREFRARNGRRRAWSGPMSGSSTKLNFRRYIKKIAVTRRRIAPRRGRATHLNCAWTPANWWVAREEAIATFTRGVTVRCGT